MRKIAFLLTLLVLSSHVTAMEKDSLWLKAQSQYKASNLWVAQDIRTQLETARPDQPKKISYVQSSLASWEKQNPVYASVNTDSQWQALPEQKKGTDSINKMLSGIDKFKDELMYGEDAPKRLDNEAVDGKSLAVYQFNENGIGQKVSVKMWIRPDTACIYKIETSARISMFADADLTSHYNEPNKEGICLQSQLQGSMDVQIPFKKGKMLIKQISNNWVRKPAS